MMSGTNQSVAVLGMGRMGTAMASRMAAAGFRVVVWNRDRSKAEAVAGRIDADLADTAAGASSSAEVILSSLADDAAVEAVYLGPMGVTEGVAPGSLVLETSTVDPATSLKVAAAVEATGAVFADCPVSGSVSTVEAGALTVMVGGDEVIAARAEPVLAAIAQRQIRVGATGSGATCKLAVNSLVHGINVALAEALVLAEKAGVSRDVAYDVFAGGAGGAPFVQYKRDAFLHPDQDTVAFSLDLVAKDLRLITALGTRVGAPMAQADTTLGIVDDALAAGMGARDMSAIASFLRETH